jgi:hypothetical protein
MEINYCLKNGKGKGNLYLPSFVVTLFCRRALMSPRFYVAALLCRTLFCHALLSRYQPEYSRSGSNVKNFTSAPVIKPVADISKIRMPEHRDDNRPYVSVKINNESITALLDSAANRSVLRREGLLIPRFANLAPIL